MRRSPRLAPETVARARELRRDMTDAERVLWRAVRTTFAEAHWRKQAPMGAYYADLASHQLKLIIEVDGGQHGEALEYDAKRTRFLERQGYRVLRFWNNEVLENIDGVLSAIAPCLSPSPSHAAAQRGPLPLPEGEGIEARRSRAPA